MLSVLERAALFFVEPLQTTFDLVMSIFSGEDSLKMEKNRNLWILVVYHGVESLDESDRSVGTASYSSAKELLLEYIESDSERVWSARRRVDLDVWLGWSSALLNLGSGKKNEVHISHSGGRFLKTGKVYLRQ